MQNAASVFFRSKAKYFLLLASATVLFGLSACKDKGSVKTEKKESASCLNIPNTPLCWNMPQGWKIKPSTYEPKSKAVKSAIQNSQQDAGRKKTEIDITSKIKNTYLVLSGSKATNSPSLVKATVEIYISDLQAKTSATDFLAENRLSQQKALSNANIRHLEVEPVHRSKRRGFIVRDSFEVYLPAHKKITLGQQALLLVDKNKGYVLVVTMEQKQLKQNLAQLRSWLNSVKFVDE